MAIGEVFVGRRPTSQLADHVTPEVLASLARRLRLLGADVVPAARTVLVTGRVQHPTPRTAEATALVRVGPRLLVLAFRIEAVDGAWVCTALEALPTLNRAGA